jgi:DNA polymerase sigma
MKSGLMRRKEKKTRKKNALLKSKSNLEKGNNVGMRVYVPDKKDAAINEVLKDLYLLRQAVDFESGNVDSRLKMIDNIRNKLRRLVEPQE